jgi:hypothetical protein
MFGVLKRSRFTNRRPQMTTKYIVRHDNQIIGNRNSKDRTYTHAIAVWGHGKTAHIATWCGRLDLAQDAQHKYQRYGYRAEILPVEVATPKKTTPANIEAALLDRFPGLKGKLIVI